MKQPDDMLDDCPLAQLTVAELRALVRVVVREELERVHSPPVSAKPPKPSAPLGFADLHAAAKHFKTSYSQVREWIVRGDAPAIEVEPNPRTKHRLWRVDLAEMDAWIRSGGPEALERRKKAIKPTPEDFAELEARARRKGYPSAREWLQDAPRRRAEKAAKRRA